MGITEYHKFLFRHNTNNFLIKIGYYRFLKYIHYLELKTWDPIYHDHECHKENCFQNPYWFSH